MLFFLKKLKSWINLFVPDFGPMLSRGFQTHIENGDLILRKRYNNVSLSLHQCVEPYNPKFGHLIDFNIEEACLIMEFSTSVEGHKEMINELREIFDYCYLRENYFFCMIKHMEFDDQRLVPLLTSLEDILAKFSIYPIEQKKAPFNERG